MKQLSLIVAAMLTLSGCVGGDKEDRSECYVSHTFTQDYHGNSGLHVKPTINGDVSYVSYNEIEKLYNEIEHCVANNNTPAPSVWFASFKHIGIGGNWGVYSAADQLVLINTDRDDRNCYSDRETIRHEFVHHVLYMNGKDHSHSSDMFKHCDALGVKVCNGKPCGN